MKTYDLYDIEQQTRKFDPKQIIEREQAAGIAFGPFHRAYLLKRAPEQVRTMLEKARLHPELVAAKQRFVAPDQRPFPDGNLRAAIATTTTETNLWDPAIHALIPLKSAQQGDSWIVRYGGVCGTTGTPTQVWTTRFGTNNAAPPTGTSLGASPTVTLGTFTAQPFFGQCVVGIRALGVGASLSAVVGNGFTVLAAAAAATVTPHIVYGGLTTVTTADLTVDQGIGVSMTWGTSNASNTLTPQWMTFHSLT